MKNKNLIIGIGLIAIAGLIYYRKSKAVAPASIPATSNMSGCGCSNADGEGEQENKYDNNPLWETNKGWGNGILE